MAPTGSADYADRMSAEPSPLFGSSFAPTPEAVRARLDAVDPAAYARTRNALDGAVTRLSPYLTHGLLDVPDALAAIRTRHYVPVSHKLAFEFGWREFFRHAWRHLGAGVLDDMRPPPWPGRCAVTSLDRRCRTSASRSTRQGRCSWS